MPLKLRPTGLGSGIDKDALLLFQYFLNQTLLQSLRQNLAHQVG
jgi:hypothetical protein